jgi:uncharacterized protein
MTTEITRKNFVRGSAALGGGALLGGPFAALTARKAEGRPRSRGYGPLFPTPEQDSGIEYLALPRGFRYRLISWSGKPMSDGSPTPGIFDGMAAFKGRHGSTVLVRNHENRSRPGEIPVVVPDGKRYDPDQEVRGGNTNLVVSSRRRVVKDFATLAGTHTNCAGGRTPWDSWITCEEIFNYGSDEANTEPGAGVPHGYVFEVPAYASGPVKAVPNKAAGRFSHEAVAWLGGALYETEDRGDACLYRFIPKRKPRNANQFPHIGGELQALVVKGGPRFDANLANPGDSYPVEWVEIEEPDPPQNTVRVEAQSKGAAIFDRTEGIWTAGDRVYFDCTTGGEAQLGQLWELKPDGRKGERLKLVYESTSASDLENPDNLVVVPKTGDVFLQEDSDGEQFVRGVTRHGAIYYFARTLENTTEFCGGCFAPDGGTLFVNQQGDRLGTGETPETQPNSERALTFAIWGPFTSGRRGTP